MEARITSTIVLRCEGGSTIIIIGTKDDKLPTNEKHLVIHRYFRKVLPFRHLFPAVANNTTFMESMTHRFFLWCPSTFRIYSETRETIPDGGD